jgi:predicted ATPase
LLTRLRIRGFKAIFDSGNIGLGSFNLFIGRNGSGKSSVLEALQWLQAATFEGLDGATTNRFGSYENLCNKRTEAIQLGLSFRTESGLPLSYQLRVDEGVSGHPALTRETCIVGRTSGAIPIVRSKKGLRGRVVRSLAGGTRLTDSDTLAVTLLGSSRGSSTGKSFVTFLRGAVVLRLSPTALAESASLKTRIRGPVLDEEGRRLPALLTLMSRPERQRLIDHLHGVLGDEYTGVGVRATGDEGRIFVNEHMRSRGGRKTYELPSQILSEGTRRLVAIYALLSLDSPPGLIAIEEIENGLDPWTLRHVLAALREAAGRGVQVLLTTHSPFFLDHVKPSEITYVSRKDGDSTYMSIKSRTDLAKYEGEVPPGAMYVSEFFERGTKKS